MVIGHWGSAKERAVALDLMTVNRARDAASLALTENPTIAVHWNKERRRQEPIPWTGLPTWYATVSTLRPIIEDGKRVGAEPGVRGDYYMFMLRFLDRIANRAFEPRSARLVTAPIDSRAMRKLFGL